MCKSQNDTISERMPVLGFRPLFFTAVFMLAGILLAQYLSVKPVWALVCCAVFAALFFVFRKCRYSSIAVFFAIMFAAMAYFSVYTAPPISNFDELGEVSIEGRVCDISRGESTDTYLLKDVSVNGTRINKRIFLTTRTTGYELDDVIAAKGELKLPASAGYRGAFDYRLYCLSKDVAYTCLSYDTGYSHHAYDVLSFINSLRYSMADKIDVLFDSEAPIVKAIVLGMDGDIEEQLYDDYRNTGISHVLVVSGLHVGIIFLALDLLLRLIRAGRIPRFLISTAGVAIFCALAGFSVSVIRAGLMCILSSTGRFLGKRTDALTTLSLPFVICVLFNPACVFSASMQLSFGAVFGIMTLSTALKPMLVFMRSEFIKDSLCASLGATLGTAPIIYSMNGSFYLPSVVINLAVVPFCSLLIPLTFAVTLIYCIFGGFTGYIAIPVRLMIRALNGVSRISALSDFGFIRGGAIVGCAILCVFIILFIASKYIVTSKRYKTIACGLFALCIAASFLLPSGLANNSITLLDARNSDAAVVKTGEDVFLIDTGKDEDTAIDFLTKSSLKPRGILITAADERKIGGLNAIVERFPDVKIYMTEAVYEKLNIQGKEPQIISGELILGDFNFTLQDSEKGTRVIARCADFSCAFLEDGAAELPETDVLKLYLRGKRQKYTGQEVAKSGAGYALISANSPTNEDTAALLDGLTVINTFYSGNITIDFDRREVFSVYEG